MADPFIGQVITVGFGFAPAPNYLPCDGRTLAIAEYDALYALIGTTYGGDGVQTFNLPDMRSRVPVGAGVMQSGPTYVPGQTGGAESVSLSGAQVGAHNHLANSVALPANASAPGPTVVFSDQGPAGETPKVFGYAVQNQANQVTLSPNAISISGGGQPHENRQPFQAINYAIAVYGVFPPRS